MADRLPADVPQILNWTTAWVRGCQDYEDMVERARRFRVRKAIPPWGVPREFWRSLFWPRLGVRTQGWGVGYNEFGYDHVGNLFRQCMCTMFALVRCYGPNASGLGLCTGLSS